MTPAARPSALFFVNPRAGGGRAAARLGRLLRATRPFGGRYGVQEVSSLDATCKALGSLDPEVVPVAAGGDGTAGLLATALDRNGAGAVMALLPLGTGNILARALGLGEPGQALRALEQGGVRHIDIMRTSLPAAPLALVSISAGFEGRFLHRYEACRFLGRPLAALAALLGSVGQATSIGLELDGQIVIRPGDAPFTAGLYNTSLYAGGLVMLPGADPADGAGESAVYQTAWAYGLALGAALRRVAPQPRADVLHRRWRTARIDCPGPLQIDGEPVAAREVSVRLERRALAVGAPTPEGTEPARARRADALAGRATSA